MSLLRWITETGSGKAEKEKHMNLRPHHLLCAQNFIGYGYNEEFTGHMERITDSLNRGGEVVLHEGCDDICGKCPHNKGGRCTSCDKVDRMDREVLIVCGLAYGDRLDGKKALFCAKEKIFETEEFLRICGSCQWYETCRKIHTQTRRIERYENIMQEAEMMLEGCTDYNSEVLQDMISKLEAYYKSDEWKKDFADDEAGRLPKGLTRGVLSEDGIYNLLDGIKKDDGHTEDNKPT